MTVISRFLIACLFMVSLGHGAFAHAVLLEADPADGGILANSPTAVRLHFNEAVTPVSIRLIGPDGKAIALLGLPKAVDQDVTEQLPEGLVEGGYILSYRVISLDTHPVGGSLSFLVGSGAAAIPASPVGNENRWEMVFPFAHGLMLISLMLVVGGALFRAFVDDKLPRRTYVSIAALVGVIAAVLAVGIRGAGLADGTLTDVFGLLPWRLALSTAMGPSLALIVAGTLLAVIAYATLGLVWMRLMAMMGAIAAATGLALTSHAALAPPVALAFPAFIVHVVVAAFWFGSLPLLVVSLARRSSSTAGVVRFSSIAIWSVAALLGAGIVLSLVQTGSDLRVWTGPAWSGAYAPVLTAKVIGVLAILCLAAYHRYSLTPRLRVGNEEAATTLGLSIRSEAYLMVIVLALAAALGSFEPPRSIGALASMHDHGGGDGTALYVVRQGYGILLEMSPAKTGSNEITLRFSDPARDGARVTPKEVVIGLALPSAGIEPLERRAKPIEDGAYRVDLMPVPTPGTWQVRVDALITDFDKILTTIDVPIEAATP